MKHFRRILSAVLALAMVLSMATVALADEVPTVTMTVSKDSVSVGDTIYVTLTTDGALTSIGSGITVKYDAAVFELDTANSTAAGRLSVKQGNNNVKATCLPDEDSPFTIAAGENIAVFAFKAIAEAESTSFTMSELSVYYSVTEKYALTIPDAVKVTVTEAASTPEYTGYAVTASEDKTVAFGESAEVKVTVSNSDSEVTTYNAYDLTITYPTDKLDITADKVVAADTSATVDVENGAIHVIGYGADKNVGTDVVTMTFTTKSTEAANVVIFSAKIDKNANAIDKDAPEATKLDDTTVISTSGYTVSLGTGLSGDATVAHGASYTFTATDWANYDYVISATMGGEPVTPTNNNDGTYTIANVTGNLEISATMTPKTYNVTINGEAADKATYNVNYTFTPTKDNCTVKSVTAKIGEDPITVNGPDDNGTYTIPGTAITGDIVITVEWEPVTSSTVTVNKGDGIKGNETATKGEDYTFSFDDTDNYDYSDLKVYIGEGDNKTDITDEVTYNQETGEYTIPGEYITGPITIEVTRTEKSPVTVDVCKYLELDGSAMYLVTVSGVAEGSVAKYDGMSMYWSAQTLTTTDAGTNTTGYGAYAWLVISTESLDTVKAEAEAKVTVAEGEAAGNVSYTGDVNGTGVIDVNDAQLTYDMYNAKHDLDSCAMLKFLNADVNSDKTVNSADAAAIVANIK